MKMIQEEICNPNTCRPSKVIDLVIFKCPMKKSQGSDNITDKSYRIFREELIPFLHKHFQKTHSVLSKGQHHRLHSETLSQKAKEKGGGKEEAQHHELLGKVISRSQ
jgi:hypothetical protein